MKKAGILFILIIVTYSISLFGRTVPYDRAKIVAENWFEYFSGQSKTQFAMSDYMEVVRGGSTNPLIHIFKNETGGWVMVSGDDIATPILGYSTNSNFNFDYQSTNIGGWIKMYEDIISDAITVGYHSSEIDHLWKVIETNISTLNNTPNTIDSYTIGTSLLDEQTNESSEWGQTYPFNTFCPYDGEEPTLAGCVATAMAQVMRYHEHPFHGWWINSYLWQGEISQQYCFADFINASYYWADMPKSFDNIVNTTASWDLIGEICYHAGVSVNMDYGVSGSGASTFDAVEALKNYFKYSSSSAYVKKSNYSEENWISLLKQEINTLRPMLYRGQGSDGGHSFVCDGYDNQDFFHFNWGWKGDNNGFYAITDLTPGDYSFNNQQAAVVAIEPAIPNFVSSLVQNLPDCAPNESIHYVIDFGEIFQGSSYQAPGYEFEIFVANSSGQIVSYHLGQGINYSGQYEAYFDAPQSPGNYTVYAQFTTVHKTNNTVIHISDNAPFTVIDVEYNFTQELSPTPHIYQPGDALNFEVTFEELNGNIASGLNVVYGLRLKNGPQFESYQCIETPNGSGHYVANLSAPIEVDEYEIYAMITEGGQVTYSTTPIDFEVFVDPPSVPVLIYPENDQENVQINTSFFWDPVEGAESYDFGIYKYVSGNLNQLFYQSGLTGSSFTPIDFTFEYDENYKWTMRARANGEIGAWATLFDFQTEYYLDEPELLCPINNSTNISLTPEFIWENIPEAEYYRIEVATDPAMNDEVASFNNLTYNFFSLPMEILEVVTDYYWTVKAYSADGTSNWSDAIKFTTGGAIPPGMPELQLPINGATSQPLTPTFEWESGTGVSISYKIEISENPDFSTILYSSEQINQLSFVIPPSILQTSTTYYWQVYGWNSSGFSVPSLSWSFTTTSTSGGAGSIIWSKQVNDIVEDQPVFDKYGFLWVIFDGNLVKVNPMNGETLLTVEGLGRQTNDKSPTISHDGLSIYTIARDDSPLIQLDTGNDFVVAIDLDGNLLWYYDTWHGNVHKPILDAIGNLYIACEDGNEQYNNKNSIISLNTNGEFRWRNLVYDDYYDFQSHPVVSGNLVYISRKGSVNLDATLFTLNTSNGQTVWSKNFGDHTIAYQSPSLSDSRIYFEDRQDDILLCYSKSNGSGVSGWPKAGLDYFKATTIIDNQGVAFNGTDEDDGIAYAYAFNQNGSVRWQKNIVDDYGDAAVLGNNGVLYFGSNNNLLYAVNKETGATIWTINLQARLRGITIGADGILYACTNIGPNSEGIYAIETTATGIAISPWPTDNHDQQGTCCYDHEIITPLPSVMSFEINNNVSITQNQQVTLNNLTIYSPSHYMASENQDFPGASWQLYSEEPTFELSEGTGQKTVYFKVKNEEGESNIISDLIYFESGMPFINEFNINNGEEASTSNEVSLNNSCSNEPTHYMASESMDFDSATWTPYGQSPEFILSEEVGLKTVYFKVKNNIGESEIVSDQIELIQSEIDAEFEANITQGITPLTIQFTDLSSGNPISWQWDFENDGTVDSDEKIPSHTYNEPGIYSVKLIVSDGMNTDSLVKYSYILVSSSECLEQIIQEDFEAYTPNDSLVKQAQQLGNDHWTTWHGEAASAEDPVVNGEIAYEGNHSVLIEGENDAVLLLDSLTEGVYLLKFNMYVPNGYNGYFNILQAFAGEDSETGMQVFFDTMGTARVDANGFGAAGFSYNYNTWNTIAISVDLIYNSASLQFSGEDIYTWKWSGGSTGFNNLNTLHGIDFFAWNDHIASKYYIDNIEVYQIKCANEFPIIQVQPDTIEVFLSQNEILDTAILISNIGQTDLMFESNRIYQKSSFIQTESQDNSIELSIPDDTIEINFTPSQANHFVGNDVTLNRNEYLINYDGDNSDSVGLGGSDTATFEPLVRFPAKNIWSYTGTSIKEVQICITEIPENLILKIYQGSNGVFPETLIYEEEIAAPVKGWNNLTIPDTIVLNGDDIWIGYRVTHLPGVKPAGCDTGTNDPNGDWFLYESGSLSKLSVFGINRNWNIRAKLNDEDGQWLTIQPESGEIAPGTNTSINLTVDANLVLEDNTICFFNIASNDPGKILQSVPVKVNIEECDIIVNTQVSDYNGFAIDCNGNETGEIIISIDNGTHPYSIEWSTGDTDVLSIENLGWGEYWYNIEDANGCIYTDTIFLDQPEVFTVQYTSHNSCLGQSNGWIELGISGGVEPYLILWDNGSTNPYLYNISGGDYHVTVSDLNGCFWEETIEIAEYECIFGIPTPSCQSECNGAIDIEVYLGVDPYEYVWTMTEDPYFIETSQDIYGLCPGEYCVTVTDFTGFESNACFIVEEFMAPELKLCINDEAVYQGDNYLFCEDQTVEILLCEVFSGNGPFEVCLDIYKDGSWYGDYCEIVNENGIVFNQVLEPGDYEFNINYYKDANDCYYFSPYPYFFNISIIASPNVDIGSDTTILAGETYQFDAMAANYDCTNWSTEGDGTFDDLYVLNPTYFPGNNDIIEGEVELCLEVCPIEPCNVFAQDCLTLTIQSGGAPWEPVWTTPFSPMNIYVVKATIDELNMVAGDEIGVFDIDPDNGNPICVGNGVLVEELSNGAYLSIIASMDDGIGSSNGFQSGNDIIFKLYSQSIGLVELVSITFPYQGYSEVFTPLGTATVELNGVTEITQILDFVEGWNLSSMRTLPDNMNMLSIANPLIEDEQLVKIINQDGGSVEHLPFPPPNGQWSSTIEDWVIEQGYYVKVNSNTSLSITAPPVEIPLSIPLRQGWNMIGMPCQYAQSTETMLQPLIDDGIIIKVLNKQGLAIEHLPFPPPSGQWVFGFQSFVPGEGYYIKAGAESELVFDCLMPYTGDAITIVTNLQFFEPVYKNNPYMPMSVVLTDIDNFTIGDEIAIYDNGICVGASVLEQLDYISIIVSMDDPLTEEVDGYALGNLLSAVVWQNSQNIISDCELQFIGGVETFHPLETYIGKLSVLLTNLSDINALEMEFIVSPNPFISYTSLNYTVPENGTIEVSVFNMAGQVEMKAENNQIFAGNGKIRIDRSTLQAGSYILQITYSTVKERKTVNKKLFIK